MSLYFLSGLPVFWGDWALEKQLLPGPPVLNSVFSVRQETNKMGPVKKSVVYFTVELAGGENIDSPRCSE